MCSFLLMTLLCIFFFNSYIGKWYRWGLNGGFYSNLSARGTWYPRQGMQCLHVQSHSSIQIGLINIHHLKYSHLWSKTVLFINQTVVQFSYFIQFSWPKQCCRLQICFMNRYNLSVHTSVLEALLCTGQLSLLLTEIFLRLSHLSLLGSRERAYWGKRVWKRLWSSKMRSLLWLTVPKLHFFHWNPDSPVHCVGTVMFPSGGH